MSQVISKVCCVCGQDVAQQKRTKDAGGNYYCQPCWSRRLQPAREQEIAVAGDPLEELAAEVPTNSAGGGGVTAGRGSGVDLALRIGFFLALAFMLLSLLAAVVTGTRNIGAGIASGAASILLWGGLAFALRVAAKKRTPSAQAEPRPASNRSVLIALGLIVVAVVGTFLVYYKLYMAPIHDSIVADNARNSAKPGTPPPVTVGDDPAKSFEAFCELLYTEFRSRFHDKRISLDESTIAVYAISDKYSINVHKTQSLTTPYIGTLTFEYAEVQDWGNGKIIPPSRKSGTITIIGQNDKWLLNEFSTLFPWKLEDGIREIAGQPK